MDKMQYRIVITGETIYPVNHRQAVTAFSKIFGVCQREAAELFREAPRMVRGGLSHEQSQKYLRVLQREGIVCMIERDTVTPEKQA